MIASCGTQPSWMSGGEPWESERRRDRTGGEEEEKKNHKSFVNHASYFSTSLQLVLLASASPKFQIFVSLKNKKYNVTQVYPIEKGCFCCQGFLAGSKTIGEKM